MKEHIEKRFTAIESVRDVVIGMADGLTVFFALAAGLTGAISQTHLIITAGLRRRTTLIRYCGQADGLTIAFHFGDEGPQASEVRITQAGQRNCTRFVLVGEGRMGFVLEKDCASGREVVLEVSSHDAPPAKLKGYLPRARSGDFVHAPAAYEARGVRIPSDASLSLA